jgi:hypothetical protein
MLSVIILRVVLIYFYSECNGAKCIYTESRVFIVNSECTDAESRHADCLSAHTWHTLSGKAHFPF